VSVEAAYPSIPPSCCWIWVAVTGDLGNSDELVKEMREQGGRGKRVRTFASCIIVTIT